MGKMQAASHDNVTEGLIVKSTAHWAHTKKHVGAIVISKGIL